MEGSFGLVESFGVDNGELDHLTKPQCFVLGYELSVISWFAETNALKGDFTVRSDNMSRIENTLKRHNREWTWKWASDDVSEEWVYLTVHERGSDAVTPDTEGE